VTISWRIELFGRLRATGPAGDILRFSTSQTSFLLARLALKPGRASSREALTADLWPEADAESARHRLRQSLVSLRRRLEPPGVTPGTILVADRQDIFLQRTSVTSDVSEFESACERANRSAPAERLFALDRACGLYSSDFLPGCDDEWAVAERERLRADAFDILRQTATLLVQSDAPDRALKYARRATDLDPLHEEACRDLMRLLARSGQVAAARRRYLKLKKALHQEIGLVPEAATQALLRRLSAHSPTPFVPTPVVEVFSPGPDFTPDPFPKSESAFKSASVLAQHYPPSLPTFLTRFFGREMEIDLLLRLLQQPHTRLLTLTGMGGTGKTRLSVEAARALRRDCVFVALSDINDPAEIGGVLGRALGLPALKDIPPLEQAIQALAGRAVLLLLDNLEQFSLVGAGVLSELLARLPLLSVLATSRTALGLGGEQEFSVVPLLLPPADTAPKTLSPADLYAYPSARLFVDRMQLVRPDFQITPRNAESVATLCRRLDGLPLALELAATWGRTLTPAQMLGQLDRRFEFLVSRRQDLPTRHRSLQIIVEWSVARLPQEVQRLFAHLSVFRGGWTLGAAMAVCAEPEAAAGLEHLREHSLILAEERGEEMRYGLLETLREFGEEQLPPTEREALCRRHARFFEEIAQQNLLPWGVISLSPQMECLDTEQSNFRQALDWCRGNAKREGGPWQERRTQDDAEVGLRLATALTWYGLVRCDAETANRLRAALAAAPGAPNALRARAWICLSSAVYLSGAYPEAVRHLARAITLLRQECVPSRAVRSELGTALCRLSHLLLSSDRPAQSILCLDTGRRLLAGGDCVGELAEAAFYSADWCFRTGHLDKVEALYREAARLFRQAENLTQEAGAFTELGYFALWQGRYDDAEEHLNRAQEFRRSLGMGYGTQAQWLLSMVAAARGDYGRADTQILECLDLRRQAGTWDAVADVLASQGDLFLAQCRFEESAQSYAEAETIRGANAAPDDQDWQRLRRGRLAWYRGELKEAGACLDAPGTSRTVQTDWRLAGLLSRFRGLLALSQGDAAARGLLTSALNTRRTTGQRRGIAECLEDLALVEVTGLNPEQAARLWGAAASLRQEIGAPLPPCDQERHDRARAAARRAVGGEVYARALSQGAASSLDALLTEILGTS